MPATPLVVIDSISKSFNDVQALRNMSLEVERSEMVVVIRPSKSEKSTLCQCINQLKAVNSRSITIDGVALPEKGRALAQLQADVSMVFQSFNLFPHKTMLQNVTLEPMKMRRLSRANAHQQNMHLLERMNITNKTARYPAELSNSQQQRATITQTLAMKPKLMLFDEPTSALDPEMIKEVLDVMEKLTAENTTMIIVSHKINFARSAAQRVMFMNNEHIVKITPPKQFFSSPTSERARDFLSKILAH